MERKLCKCCKKELPLSDFNKHGRTPDGLSVVCRDCRRKNVAQNRDNARPEPNPELAEYEPRELIEELKARGYTGELWWTPPVEPKRIKL